MTRGDITVLGLNGGTKEYRVAASATRGYSGEPLEFNGTYTTGVASVNTVVVCADATPVVGTDNLVGIAAGNMTVDSAGTVTAHRLWVTTLIPDVTRIEGRIEGANATMDTDTELLGFLWDFVLFDLTSGAYTIDETATADTSALTVRDGNIERFTLEVTADVRAFRADVTA